MKILEIISSLIINIKIYIILFVFTLTFQVLANEDNSEFNLSGNINTDR